MRLSKCGASRLSIGALICSLGLSNACIEPIRIEEEIPATDPSVGETRYIELRFLRLDVEGFGKTVSLEQLRALPQSILDEVWLLDMDMSGLVRNALEQLRDLSESEAAQLPVAGQNMRRLLRTTPDNIVLTGTNLEELIGLASAIGVPAAAALAEVLQVGITEEVIPIDAAANATIQGLIATHPSAQERQGLVDDEHPDGVYPVAQNSIPVTLGDVVNNFEDLPARFGPVETELGMHPGFIEEAVGFTVVEDEFEMTMRISANALPFKGVDATRVTQAAVNSLGGQIESLFDTDDPDWLTVVGLVADPYISSMTVSIVENDAFIPGGDSQEPAPLGNSEVWDLPPWEFERLVAAMVLESALTLDADCITFELGTGVDAFTSCVDENAWVTFETFNDIGSPPAAAYMWDLQSELAQVRLHDGGLAEGEADVQFALADVYLGVSAEEITQEIADNIAANPTALKGLANALSDATDGEADFFYFRPAPGGAPEHEGDWLFFVIEDDIPLGEDGESLRPYAYEKVGFFSDEACTNKVSEQTSVEGDDSHEKIKVGAGDRYFFQDDAGRVYRLDVAEKPSTFKVGLEITRVS